MSRQPVVESTRAIVDVVDYVSLDEPNLVGVIATAVDGHGWTRLTPDEAITVAAALVRAAQLCGGRRVRLIDGAGADVTGRS